MNSEVVGDKVNTQNPVVFLYTIDEQPDEKLRKSLHSL
jgi:hypothetical protein